MTQESLDLVDFDTISSSLSPCSILSVESESEKKKKTSQRSHDLRNGIIAGRSKINDLEGKIAAMESAISTEKEIAEKIGIDAHDNEIPGEKEKIFGLDQRNSNFLTIESQRSVGLVCHVTLLY